MGKKGKLVPSRMGKFKSNQGGFPDFIIYRTRILSNYEKEMPKILYEIQFVECKSNGYLKSEEKQKAKWYIENKFCSKFVVASKGKKRGEIVYKEFK